ncbi:MULTISPECIES: hypothetical protein [unclassified Bradyrhizobium]
MSAKIVDQAGQVKVARLFDKTEAIGPLAPSEAAAAFNHTFGALARELVIWVARPD